MRRLFPKKNEPDKKKGGKPAAPKFEPTPLVVPDNIDQLREDVLRVLSDPERANDFVRASEFVKNMFKQPKYRNLLLTFPVNFLMKEQELPKAHRLVDVRRDAVKFLQDREVSADVEALPFDERFPNKCAEIRELNPKLFEYFNRLPTEDQILIICVLWSFAGELHTKIEKQIEKRYLSLDTRCKELSALVRETNKQVWELDKLIRELKTELATLDATKDKTRIEEINTALAAARATIIELKTPFVKDYAEIEKLNAEMKYISENEMAGLAKRLIQPVFQQIVCSLTRERVADALLRFHLDMPAFSMLADELTRLEMMTELDDDKQTKRKKYVESMQSQICAATEGIPVKYVRGKNLEYNRLFPVCHAMWREVASDIEIRLEDDSRYMLQGILKLSSLSDEAFEAQANKKDDKNDNNADRSIPILKEIVSCINMTMRDVKKFILEQSGMEELPSDVMQYRMLRILSPILREDNLFDLVMNNKVLENLERLVNHRAWSRIDGGRLALEHLKVLLRVLKEIRNERLWEITNTGLNLDAVTLNDLYNLYNYRSEIMKRRIQGIHDAGGMTSAEMAKQLESYNKIIEELKTKTHDKDEELSELNKKMIILSHIKEIDSLPLKLSSKESSETIFTVDLSSIASADVELLSGITQCLQEKISDVTTDKIDNLVQWVRVAKPSSYLQAKLIELNFMQQCVHILQDKSPIARTIAYELLELLKDKAVYRDGCELNMRGCDLSKCKITDLTRSNVFMNHAMLNECFMINCKFSACSFGSAKFCGSTIEDVDFIESNMQTCDMQRTNLTNVCFMNSDLTGALLGNATLVNVKFIDCNLTDVSFAGVTMDDTTLCALLYPMDQKLTEKEWTECFNKMAELDLSPAARLQFIMGNFQTSAAYTMKELEAILLMNSACEMSVNINRGAMFFAAAPNAQNTVIPASPKSDDNKNLQKK